jgi:Fur family ferric uptake transcriptional regulator
MEKVNPAEQMLRESGLRITHMRMQVIEMLLEAESAISKKEIEDHFDAQIDRVTLYRTIKSFEEKGIVHAVADLEGNMRFALCRDTCQEGHHHDSHVHFICQTCGVTRCLDDTPIPAIPVAGKLEIRHIQVTASGICERCNQPAPL